MKDSKKIQLITTSDGSHTIYLPELDEHYHSIHGAVQESMCIFINNGFDACKADPLNIFECADIKEKEASRSPFPPGSKESDALAELDLNWPVTQESVKACYKKLVKRHHPDANNGCKEAEERFKRIKNAYEILMPRLVELELNV